MTTSKVAVKEELRKENINAKETRRVLDEARKNADEANKVFLASEKAKKNLEAQVDVVEAQAKLAKDALAKTEAEVEQKIIAWKDELIDVAMYSFWVANQNADISFLENEAEGLLAKWKVLLEEEKELLSITDSEAIAELDDVDGEVSSQSLKIPRSEAPIAAKINDLVKNTPVEAALQTNAPTEMVVD